MKLCLVCSHGGHLTEILQILSAFEGHEIFFATYRSVRTTEVMQIARTYFTDNIGYSIFPMIKAIFWTAKILLHERPNVIVSTGSEIAVPFFYLGKLMSIKTIFIEGLFRVTDLSITGRLVYPVADVFLVQWPQLLEVCGSKARYEGAVI